MRVVIAPGSFGPGLPAVQAAAAIAEGWARRSPGDDLVLAPVSDGGAGLIDVLAASLGGQVLATVVPDSWGAETPAVLLLVDGTAYVETAQVVSRPAADDDVQRASSLGVGRLVAEALGAGAERVIVGVGPSGVVCNDGGAGVLDALGVLSEPIDALRAGSLRLDTLTHLDLASPTAVSLLSGTEITLATDDDSALLGLLGTTSTAGPGRGLTAQQVQMVDARLERFADLAGRKQALAPGAGAGGGIGYALLLLGATKAPGLRTVLDEISLAGRAASADLVVTGEEAFDLRAGSGLVSTGVAALAGSVVRPCIALANRVGVGSRETRALGIESAYDVEQVTGADPSWTPADRLAALAERVARTWSWSR